MLQIFRQSIVFILCPTGSVTGGPEALHQLCHKINCQGGNAKMVYVEYGIEKFSGKVGTPLRYRHYSISVADYPIDDEHNVIIVPELWPHLLERFSKIQKCIWWLSVNHAGDRFNVAFSNQSIHHLYQSSYAKDFLIKNQIANLFPLYDYLSLPASKKGVKERIVIYNPKKGWETTKKIIAKFKDTDIQFVALQGFTRSELLQVMKRSMVYIDFGDHPGKDRIPREAVIQDNIIIVSQNGSANFHEDIPILSQFKISDQNIDQIGSTITKAINDYQELTTWFNYYRRVVASQETEFALQAKNLFCPGSPGFIVTVKHTVGIDSALKFYFDLLEKVKERLRVLVPSSLKTKLRRFGNN